METVVTAEDIYIPPDDPRELLKLSPEIQRYFDHWVSAPYGSIERVRQIVEAIIVPQGLNFVYDPEATFDARTAFRVRRGNCVTFALLVAAVTREYGFSADFQNVQTPARWDRFGDLIVSVQHINVRVATDSGDCIVDLRPDLIPRADSFAAQGVADRRAYSEFYNDIGFFHLVHGRPAQGLKYITRATEVDPTCASAWSNRATLHARLGDLAGARQCFERSLRIDRGGITAIVGFVGVLHQLGTPADLEAAAKLQRRAEVLQQRNPYYHEHMAERAQENGDWATAEKSLRRAIAIKSDEPAFYEQLVAVLEKLGRTRDAERTSARLKRLRTRLSSASIYLVR